MCLSWEDLRDVQGQGFSNGALLMAFRGSGVTTVRNNFGEYIETLSIFYFGVKGIVFRRFLKGSKIPTNYSYHGLAIPCLYLMAEEEEMKKMQSLAQGHTTSWSH